MLKDPKFSRKKEDFICDVCGQLVHGDGYTNHCPNCLCSKHVDINPGDRACACQGIMHPIRYELKHGKEYIIHKCQKCGYERANKVSPDDARATVRLVASGQWTVVGLDLNKKA